MTISNVINAYRLFLGRNPESDAVAQKRASAPLPASIAGFVISEEFSSRVLVQLVNNYPLPHTRLSILPDAEMCEWAASQLPVTEVARKRISASRTWRQLLMHTLVDPEFFKEIGVSSDRDLIALLREQYAQRSAPDLEREVIGVIDSASAFEISGWAANLLDLSERVRLEFLLDNVFIGTAECSRFRRDVQEKFGGDGHYGFSFIVPAAHHRDLQRERLLTARDALSKAPIAAPALLHAGQHETLDSLAQIRREIARLTSTLLRIEEGLPDALGQLSFPLAMYHEYQEETRRMLANGRATLSTAASALKVTPMVSVVILDRGVGAKGLKASVKSLQDQIYENWECLVEDPDGALATDRSALLDKLASADLKVRTVNTGATMNDVFGAARGDYILNLEQGDVLAEHALYEIVRGLQDGNQRIVTFDEDTIAIDEFRNYRFSNPKLKPSFDYDFLLASNYVDKKFFFARDLFERVRGFDPSVEDVFLDLLLRMLEVTDGNGVAHIARVLYHNVERHDLPRPSEPAEAAILDCINAHFKRIGSGAVAIPHEDPFGEARSRCQRIRWPQPALVPVVSIIIPTRDRADLLGPCLASVFATERNYPTKFEVIVVDHESEEHETHDLLERFRKAHGINILPFGGSFNWSAINNAAARIATGDILLFLNNDTVVLSDDWVGEMASQLARPSVGAVGVRLLYGDGTVQHAGVVFGPFGGATHEGVGQETRDAGYLGRCVLQRNALAVTGACMATRAALFRELGGFDESDLGVEFNDVDYCLKVCDNGLSVIYTPFTTLYHFESKSRGLDKTLAQELSNISERKLVAARWRKFLEKDPYYNEHFERFSRPFSRLKHPEMLGQVDTVTVAQSTDIVPWFD